MRIALTGGSGAVGTAITAQALRQGHTLVSIDRTLPPTAQSGVDAVVADICDYDALLAAIAGCDALIHMAAIPAPFRLPDHVVHNNNVVGSYNAMRGAIEHGIRRICQASSVNAPGLTFSRVARFDYFPVDEAHPNHGEDAYSLSKWICEVQADNLVRRYEDLRIASLRLHWVVPDRDHALNHPDKTIAPRNLWGYVRSDAVARAALTSLEADFTGHEIFYIAAPDTCSDTPTLEIAVRDYPNVPIRADLSGHTSFFSSAKAQRILGWTHETGGAAT